MIGLYAIAQGAPEGGEGATGEPLRLLRCCGLELVCGACAPAISESALRAHEAVVRRIADASGACLPARFGACASSEEELLRLVEARGPELAEALRLVRGREQMTVRVIGAAEPGEGAGGPGIRYLERRRRAVSLPQLDPLRGALSDLVRAERIEPHAEPGLLASVYHLIDRGSAARYRAAAGSVDLGEIGLRISGPWPAWSFAPELAP